MDREEKAARSTKSSVLGKINLLQKDLIFNDLMIK